MLEDFTKEKGIPNEANYHRVLIVLPTFPMKPGAEEQQRRVQLIFEDVKVEVAV